MELREPTPEDTDRIREMVDSSMTTSYRLSPQQIDAVTEDEFSDDALTRAFDDEDAVSIVAENSVNDTEPTVAGIVLGSVEDGVGEIRWLFVDPEHRGLGIGTELFEAAMDAFRDRDVERIQAIALEKNTEGEQFFEHLDLERTEERTVELGDVSFVEYAYTEPSDATDKTDSAKTDDDEIEFPDTELEDGVRTATTEDGQEVYVDTEDDGESGTEAPFFAAYLDAEWGERYGYYCANCGSLNVQMDDMERMECAECGNSHANRSGEYDGSYL